MRLRRRSSIQIQSSASTQSTASSISATPSPRLRPATRLSRDTTFVINDLSPNVDSDGTNDRASSVHSAPEDIDDYYRISAYYGRLVDDDDKNEEDGFSGPITEIQELSVSDEIPEDWDRQLDHERKPYYVDMSTGEWYRVKANQHRRINTNEKISIITETTKRDFVERKGMEEDSRGDEDEKRESIISDMSTAEVWALRVNVLCIYTPSTLVVMVSVSDSVDGETLRSEGTKHSEPT